MNDKHLLELGIFKQKGDGRFKLVGTSIEYYPQGRSMYNRKNIWTVSQYKWWKRGRDRLVRPISIDQVLKELPYELKMLFIFNITLFRD